jgi:hypothetical protein
VGVLLHIEDCLDFSFSNHGEHSANILNIVEKNVCVCVFFLGAGSFFVFASFDFLVGCVKCFANFS